MDYEKDEQVIYFKDLIFVSLYQWRRILVFAVVLALLSGGFMGVNSWKEYTASIGTLAEEKKEYQLQLQQYETQKLTIQTEKDNTVQTLNDMQQTVQNSPLAGYDAYSIYTAYALYTATVVQPSTSTQTVIRDNTHTVMQSYNALLIGQTAANTLAKALGFDVRYIGEVLSTSYNSDARTLKISFTYTSAEKAKEGLAILQQLLAESQENISKATADHTLNLVVEDLQNVTFDQLQVRWAEKEEACQKLKNRLAELEEEAKALVPPVAPEQISKANIIKEAIIFAIIGAVLGSILAAAYSCLHHLAGSKVYSKRTLQGHTHIETIAAMDDLKGNAFDSCLRRLEGRTTGRESHDICGRLVQQYCADSDKVQLLYCGTQSQTDLENALGNKALSAQAGTLKAVEQLAQCDSVVLVAQCHVSRYDMLRQQAEQISALGKKLVGCVLIDG